MRSRLLALRRFPPRCRVRTPARVAFVVGQLGRGGTERQVVLLASGLQQRGVDVSVVTLFAGGARELELLAAGVRVVHAHFPNVRSAPRSAWRLPFAFVSFVRLLRRLAPDVVHAFLYEAYVVTPFAAKFARAPLVVAGRRSLGNFKEGRRIALLLERVATSFTDVVIANCEAVARDVARQEQLVPSKLCVIANALPEESYVVPDPARLGVQQPVVLSVANLIGYKGHRYLVEAVADVSRQTALTLVLVGDGPLRAELEALAARLEAPVVFLGEQDDVPALLAAADVVVLASLEEGMSNALMEALAAGKPVIATDVGGNPEVLGDAGVLVRPGDARALAEALLDLLRDDSRRSLLAGRAVKRAEKLFVADRMIDEHLDIYGRALVARCAG